MEYELQKLLQLAAELGVHVDTIEKHLQKTCIAHETANASL